VVTRSTKNKNKKNTKKNYKIQNQIKMLASGIIKLPKPIESYSSVQKQQKYKNGNYSDSSCSNTSNNSNNSKNSKISKNSYKSSQKTTYKKVQEFNSNPTKVPWMPDKKFNDKRQKSDKIYTRDHSQFDKTDQSPKFQRKNNYSKRMSSPKRFSSSKPVTLADLNANAHSLSKSDGEKVNWFYAGPKNAPEAIDLPLPDLRWIRHFSTHGKYVMSAR